jgi:SAM-dependent methyltransferase
MDYSAIFSARASRYVDASVRWPDVRAEEFETYLQSLQLQPGERLLDVPCGVGQLCRLKPASVNFTGLDPAADFVSACASSNVPAVQGSLRASPFVEQAFDVVGSLTGVHHEADRHEIYSEWHRLLCGGGRLVVLDVWQGSGIGEFLNGFVNDWNSLGHCGVFLQDADLQALRSVGFVDVVVREFAYHWRADSDASMHAFMQDLFGLDLRPSLSLMQEAWQQLGWQPSVGECRIPWTLSAVTAKKVRETGR